MQRRLYSYENFDLTAINSPTFVIFVAALYVGILFGVLSALLYRVYSHLVIKALLDHGASDRDSAKTLSELGLSGKRFVKGLLKTDGAMRRVVLCANELDFPERKLSPIRRFWRERVLKNPLPPKTDFTIARFYLPEEKKDTAEIRFTPEKHPVRSFILASLGLLALAILTVFVLPELLSMLDNFLTQVKPQSKFY